MKKRTESRSMMDVLFVLILFLVFTASALTVILVGAKVYESTASHMEDNYTVRTALAYISEKIRQFDEQDAVSITDLQGTPAVTLSQEIEGTDYCTYLYFYDQALCELFIKASSEPSLSGGNRIIELQDFSMQELSEGIYEFTAVSQEGETLRLLIHPKSNQEDFLCSQKKAPVPACF